MADNPRRYPGAGPFSEAQAPLFCGRDADLKRLLQLLARQKQVLIYAKSGVGKSSLINAGLIPALETEGRRSIKVRFYPYTGGTMPPLARVLQAMPAVPADSYLRNIFPDHDGLWLRFKAQQALRPDALLLVFDQFEELFSYPPEQIQAFKQEMAELLHEAMPERYQPILDNAKDLEDAIYTQLYAPLDLQLVAAIREDKLSYIHQLSDALPDLRHNYFELKPLSSAQAREAIVKPSRTPGNFASPMFAIEEDAVEVILAELTKGEKPVEPTLLQVVCQQLETDMIAEPGKTSIQASDLPKFYDILKDFYLGVIGKIPAATQASSRKFIEGELIQDGVRVPVAEQKCIVQLSRPILVLLANVHLIRAEHNSTGGLSYELSHDILVEPISELRVLRETEEKERDRVVEDQRLREELEREQAARILARGKLRKARMILGGLSIAIAVTIAMSLYANRMRRMAEKNETRLDSSLTAIVLEQNRNERILGTLYFYDDKFALAYGMLHAHQDNFFDAFGAFYFIDRSGKQIEKLGILDEASPFDVDGYCNGRFGQTNFLMDTFGRRFTCLMSGIEGNDDVEAWDLRGNKKVNPLMPLRSNKLRVLLASRCKTRRVDPSIFDCTNLQDLVLRDNLIEELPTNIACLGQLERLDLGENRLSAIPPEIRELCELRVLLIDNNCLSGLPDEIADLDSLEHFGCRMNYFETIPNQIWNLGHLTSLDFSDNSISVISEQLGKLQNLKSLSLAWNRIIIFPREILSLPKLQTLHIGHNPCSDTPEKREAIRQRMKASLPNCKVYFD